MSCSTGWRGGAAEHVPSRLRRNRTGNPRMWSIDYVGSLENAAVVISRLGRGEKRLVFVDSRSGAEQLGTMLGQLGTTAFVTHSSLSANQRQQAEEAFANRDDCVIVATSVLELGIDVGDLDRVIQIDAPTTVSSFLQRMGRTGRQTGGEEKLPVPRDQGRVPATNRGIGRALGERVRRADRTAALPMSYPCSADDGTGLQERGIERRTWFEWMSGMPGFRSIPEETREKIVRGC